MSSSRRRSSYAGLGARHRGRLWRDRSGTRCADRRRVGPGAPARRRDPWSPSPCSPHGRCSAPGEPARVRRSVDAVPGDGRVRRPDRADPIGRRAAAGHGGGGGARRRRHGAARVRMFLPGDEGADRVRSATWPAEADVGEPDLVLPIEHAGEPIGDLAVAKPSGDPLDRPSARSSRTSRRTPGIGLENARLSVDLERGRRSSRRRPRSSDAPASGSSRSATRSDAGSSSELRDGVGAELAAIRDGIRDDAERVVADPDEVRASLERLERARDRRAGRPPRGRARIFPPLLVDEGLAAALGALARRAGNRGRSSRSSAARRHAYDARGRRRRSTSAASRRSRTRSDTLQAVGSTRAHPRGPGRSPSRSATRRGVRCRRASTAAEGLPIMPDRMAALGGTLTIESSARWGTTVSGRCRRASSRTVAT